MDSSIWTLDKTLESQLTFLSLIMVLTLQRKMQEVNTEIFWHLSLWNDLAKKKKSKCGKMLRLGASTRRVHGYSLYSFIISIGLWFYNIIKIGEKKNKEKFKVRKQVMVQQPWTQYLTTPDQTRSCQEQTHVHFNVHSPSTMPSMGRLSGVSDQWTVDTWMRFQLQHISHGSLTSPLRVPVKRWHQQPCETFVHIRM